MPEPEVPEPELPFMLGHGWFAVPPDAGCGAVDGDDGELGVVDGDAEPVGTLAAAPDMAELTPSPSTVAPPTTPIARILLMGDRMSI